ncbi:hypothetical protein AVEN_48778-1 [Araneus ventricosus]|uniref:Retroviral polymerase SH3-like domain-containing protein n=1 Tax=Araneus ventricosus TaxID=182803 RepID=A0A4Y2VIC3_ARAVE|nr:hypothetical protein AVEN_48778-1 [Araneus ventricosus]
MKPKESMKSYLGRLMDFHRKLSSGGYGVYSGTHGWSKLDPNAKECVLVGHPEGVKGYKLWYMKKKSFFTVEMKSSKMWRRAMEEENENLQNTQPWELVTKPEGIKFIISKWLFRKKMDEAGNCMKFKA